MPKPLQSLNLKAAVLRSLQQFRSQRRPAPTLLPQMKALISPSPQLPSRLMPHVRPQSPNLTSAVLWGLLMSPPWKISPSSIHSWPALPGLLLSVLEKTRSPARHPRHRGRVPRRLLSQLQLPPPGLLLSVLQAQSPTTPPGMAPTRPGMLLGFLLPQLLLAQRTVRLPQHLDLSCD